MIFRDLFAGALVLACAAPAHAALVISQGATSNVSCAAGVCSATAADAVLNVKSLRRMLNTADVTVKSGSAAMDIVVADKLSWAKNTHFALDAFRGIAFEEAVTAEGTGSVTLTTNDGGSDGDYTFTAKGKLTFADLTSSLVVNANPYVLVDSLNGLDAAVRSNASGFFALARGIDVSGKAYTTSPVRGILKGAFDGLGHAVENLTVTGARRGCLGMFKFTDALSVIRDLRLLNVDVTATHFDTEVGALVGCGRGDILYSSAAGTVSAQQGSSIAGGLAGTAGQIFHSSAAVNVATGADVNHDSGFAGGLVGENFGEIFASHASGTVSAAQNGKAGGLVGFGSMIFNSSAIGPVAGGNGRFALSGGLVAQGGSISQSWSSGTVSAGRLSTAGGLVGRGTSIANSYATGAVQGAAQGTLGGLIGRGGDATASYSSGAITPGVNKTVVGGFIGEDDDEGLLTDAYWDTDSSGVTDASKGAGNIADDPGIAGLTTAQFQSGLPAGFDASVWGEDAAVNGGLPYLIANPPR